MLERLSLHVVEETTSLSNVFKSSRNKEVPTRKISIRDLRPKPVTQEVDEVEVKQNSLVERERALESTRASIEEEKKQVEKMKQVATDEIASMKNAWEEEKVTLQQEAYEEGFQVGFSEGRDKALADMHASIEEANAITRKSKEIAEDYQQSQERVILEIAMRSANRILNGAIREDEEKYLEVVRRAILEVREMKEVKLYVSAEKYPLVSENRSELAAILPPDTPFLIFVNEDFDELECYIETNHGRIVVTIDEQLAELREKLIEILEKGD